MPESYSTLFFVSHSGGMDADNSVIRARGIASAPGPPLARAIKRVEARGRPGITYHVRVERR